MSANIYNGGSTPYTIYSGAPGEGWWLIDCRLSGLTSATGPYTWKATVAGDTRGGASEVRTKDAGETTICEQFLLHAAAGETVTVSVLSFSSADTAVTAAYTVQMQAGNVAQWLGTAPATPSVAGIPAIELRSILATALTESSPGYLAAALKKFFNVAAPANTVNDLGTAASQTSILAAVNAITTNTARSMPVVPGLFVRPASGSTAYGVELYLYNLQGVLEAPDAPPAIAARDASGTSLNDHLGSTTMALVAAGHYKATYTVQSTDAQEAVYFDFSWSIGGTSMADSGAANVQDAESLATLTAIAAKTQYLPSAAAGAAGGLPVLDGNADLEVAIYKILATALTETSTGRLAAALKKFLDVASPAFTAASVNQTADVGSGVNVITLPATPPDGYASDTNASHFTGAFPVSTLVNAPRTGMSLADASQAQGPVSSTSDEDIYVTVFKNSSPRLCARVYFSGADVQQADVSSIVYSIYLLDNNDPDSRTAVAGHSAASLAPSGVIFDALQSDAQASSYNFRHQIPVSSNNAFTIAGGNYLVEYTLAPVAGERIIVRFRVNVI